MIMSFYYKEKGFHSGCIMLSRLENLGRGYLLLRDKVERQSNEIVEKCQEKGEKKRKIERRKGTKPNEIEFHFARFKRFRMTGCREKFSPFFSNSVCKNKFKFKYKYTRSGTKNKI